MYRVGLVCEGPADRVILEAILERCLGDYEPLYIQPPRSALGGDAGGFGGGWKGVRTWCAQEASVGGGTLGVLSRSADFVVFHVDADVAEESDSGIELPEGARCPPPTTFTDPVRTAALSWLGVRTRPPKLVLCVPAMATETWALAALYPREIQRVEAVESGCIECDPDIKAKLRRLGKDLDPKLVISQGGRLKNQARGYEAVAPRITEAWPVVVATCSEAARFDQALRRQCLARWRARVAGRRLRRGRRRRTAPKRSRSP